MMSNKILEYLEQLDLSETEAQLYLKLLETGPISVRDLAQTTGLKRTTAYLHVDLLVEKGLVMKIVKGSQKQVAANPPGESLEYLVKKKLETATAMNTGFPSMLEDITKSIPQSSDVTDAEIKYYKGKSGVKKIYEEALKAKELRSYVNPTIISKYMPENTPLFAEGVKNNSGITLYEIFEGSNLSQQEINEFTRFVKEHDKYHCKILPKDITISAADTLIYDGKVSIINIGEQITGVVLVNAAYYNNSKELFDFIWKVLPNLE